MCLFWSKLFTLAAVHDAFWNPLYSTCNIYINVQTFKLYIKLNVCMCLVRSFVKHDIQHCRLKHLRAAYAKIIFWCTKSYCVCCLCIYIGDIKHIKGETKHEILYYIMKWNYKAYLVCSHKGINVLLCIVYVRACTRCFTNNNNKKVSIFSCFDFPLAQCFSFPIYSRVIFFFVVVPHAMRWVWCIFSFHTL